MAAPPRGNDPPIGFPPKNPSFSENAPALLPFPLDVEEPMCARAKIGHLNHGTNFQLMRFQVALRPGLPIQEPEYVP